MEDDGDDKSVKNVMNRQDRSTDLVFSCDIPGKIPELGKSIGTIGPRAILSMNPSSEKAVIAVNMVDACPIEQPKQIGGSQM